MITVDQTAITPKLLMSVSKYTAFRCPTDLLELAKLRAKQDRRSLSNFLIVLLERELEGMELPTPTKPVKPPRTAKRAQ